jgi:hypothetical protein
VGCCPRASSAAVGSPKPEAVDVWSERAAVEVARRPLVVRWLKLNRTEWLAQQPQRFTPLGFGV